MTNPDDERVVPPDVIYNIFIRTTPQKVWDGLLDPENLRAVIPGCHSLDVVGRNDYRAEVSLGVGPVRGRFRAVVKLTDLVLMQSGRMGGSITGEHMITRRTMLKAGAASGAGWIFV